MGSKTVSSPQSHTEHFFNVEWEHQLRTLENSIKFFEEHFDWSQKIFDENPDRLAKYSEANFYKTDLPNVLKEARESLQILQHMCMPQDPNNIQ